MNPSETNDPIDALLREQNLYLDDAGFTTRVIKSLPRRRRPWLRPAILLGAAGIGSVLAIRWLPWNHLIPLNWSSLNAMFAAGSQSWLPLLTVFLVVASLAWSVVSALQWEE